MIKYYGNKIATNPTQFIHQAKGLLNLGSVPSKRTKLTHSLVYYTHYGTQINTALDIYHATNVHAETASVL